MTDYRPGTLKVIHIFSYLTSRFGYSADKYSGPGQKRVYV